MKNGLVKLLSVGFIFVATSILARAAVLGVESSPEVNGVQIKQENNLVTVHGSANRRVASHRVPGSHVHIELLDSQGKVVRASHQSLPPTAPKKDAVQGYRASYSTTFSQQEAAKASKVKVKYIERSHSECLGKKSC